MARAPAVDPETRRAQILDASRQVFADRGYHGAGISDIVSAVGVARGTFYRYYDSKRVVFQAVVSQMMAEVVGVVRPIDIQRPIPEQVRANLERLVRAITAEDVCRVLFTEAVGIDAEGDEMLRSFYAQVLDRIEQALGTGQALGVVRPGSTRMLARCLLGLIKEPVVQAAIDGEPLDVEVLVSELLGLLSDGLLVANPGG